MKIISCVADKGGVGKTLMACNIAFNLSLQKRLDGSPVRVLLIDFDTQGNSTDFCSSRRSDIAGASAIFQEEPTIDCVPAVFNGEVSENLFISPVNEHLQDAMTRAEKLTGREYLLEDALEDVDFDYVVIDCPPTPGCIQKLNALSCSTDIIIPVTADINSINGVSGIVAVSGRSNRNKPVIRVVRNRLAAARKSVNSQQEAWLHHLREELIAYQSKARRSFELIFEDMHIPENVIAADALFNRCPVILADRKSPVSMALEEFTNKIK